MLDDNDTVPSDYLDTLDLPPRKELWAAVQEARDYLYDWVNDPSSRTHREYGDVYFNAGVWGIPAPNGGCWVCLAGLRYLREESKLLSMATESLSSTDLFLDTLRDPENNRKDIERWLGVPIPYDIYDQLSIGDTESSEDILTFLDWLLKQKEAQDAV